ncbi:hypothetical protein ACFFGH_11465 [Lysobacter korlensis]|uniref:Uncharacterized protein n=1 Tax=Lysobacter korlensis TaxID=553636 RepID=A0ABV6RN99_9GAMM
MTTDTEQPDAEGSSGSQSHPNASPELQDAIRSIDAIGENAWGRDDDQDVSRSGPGAAAEDPAATDPSLQDTPEGNPDAP